jgi:hypothetical protein
VDERELEQRVGARLHARYDAGGPSEAYRATLMRSLTPQAARGGGSRRLIRSAGPILAAAAVVVIAVVALSLRQAPSVGPGASPSTTASPSVPPSASSPGSVSASPSAVPSPSAAGPVGSVPPGSTAAWTGLTVQSLAGAPAGLGTVVQWSGGYVGFASDAATGASTAWSSRDGRTWTALPPTVFGLTDTSGNTLFDGGTSCGGGVLVVMLHGVGVSHKTALQWSSPDGVTWTSTPLAGDRSGTVAGTNPDGSMASTADSAIKPALSGPAVDVTTDCSTWHTVRLPGPSTGSVRSVAANSAGYVAVGYSASSGSSGGQPLAWSSADGTHWTTAAVAAKKGDAFSLVYAGASGFVATSLQPGVTPGITSMWASADGTRWAPSGKDPLGVIDSCAGSGSVAGSFAGDGTHLLVYGPQGGCSGPLEYWTSLDGTAWTKLALTGDATAVTSGSDSIGASLLRDGILFGGSTGAWFGAATTP